MRHTIEIPAWHWDECDLPGAAWQLMLAIARHGTPTAAHGGRRGLRLAASHATLARLARIARSSVPGALEALSAAGLLALPATRPGAPTVAILLLDPPPPGRRALPPDLDDGPGPADIDIPSDSDIDLPGPEIGTHHHDDDDPDLRPQTDFQHHHRQQRPDLRAAQTRPATPENVTRQKPGRPAAARKMARDELRERAEQLMDEAGVTNPARWLSRWAPDRITAALEHANAVGARNPAGMAYYLLASDARLEPHHEVDQWTKYDSPLYRLHLAARASLPSPTPSASTT